MKCRKSSQGGVGQGRYLNFQLFSRQKIHVCLYYFARNRAFSEIGETLIFKIQIQFIQHKIHPFKMYNCVEFLKYITKLCNRHHRPILEHLHCAKKKPMLISSHPPFLPPETLFSNLLYTKTQLKAMKKIFRISTIPLSLMHMITTTITPVYSLLCVRDYSKCFIYIYIRI